MSNFFDQLISDRAQNFGNIIICWEESFGEFWGKFNHWNYAMHPPLHLRNELLKNLKCAISLTNWFKIEPKTWVTTKYVGRSHPARFEGNPITRTMQCTNHSIYGTNFVRTWSVQFLWPIEFGSIPKLGQHHNMYGGDIQRVLREIQLLELRSALTTPFTERTLNKLEMSNFFDQLISDRAQKLGNIIIWWEESFSEFWGKSNH